MASDTLPVDPSNAEQMQAWNDDEGRFWAENADRFDRSIAPHHARLMAAAAVAPDDRVLDVGCGCGETTLDAARAARSGSALGVDLSAPMLEVARARASAAGVDNASFEQADAQVHPFEPGAFDVVLSRTAAMFFGDQVAAFSNLRRAVHDGGRIALLTWQAGSDNVWIREIATALAVGRPPRVPPPGVGPFSLAVPDTVRGLLSATGFTDVDLDGVEAPMWFGHDADDATDFILGVSGWMLDGLDDADRRRGIEALHATCARHETADGVTFPSAAWVVTARAA